MAEKHALVIGIDKYEHLDEGLTRLEGCVNDAEKMSEVLEDSGFRVTSLTSKKKKKKPTRQRILAAVDELVSAVGSGDVVVIFYAGHGAYYRTKDGLTFESIVPSDSGRGGHPVTDVFDWEIEEWVEKLERKTDNVTLIFDSCHSGDVARVRSVAAPGRQAPPVTPEMFGEGSVPAPPAGAGGRTRGATGWLPRGGREAVALAACHQGELAQEHSDKKHGVFTWFLLKELDKLEAGTTWGDVAARVAHRVRDHNGQQPQIEGDGARVVFGSERIAREPSLSVLDKDDDVVQLSGGALDGVTPDSEWTICTRQARHRGGGTAVATVRVERLGLRTSTARVEELRSKLKKRQRAFPVAGAALAAAVAERLRGLRNSDRRSALQQAVDAGSFAVEWRDLPAMRTGGSALCRITLGGGEEPPGTELPVDTGAVTLAGGTLVNVEIANNSGLRGRATLLQITVGGDVGLLWPRTDHFEYVPGGEALGGGTVRWSEYLKKDPDLADLEHGVPLELDPDAPRPLTLQLVLSERPVDLGFLERPESRGDDDESAAPDWEVDWAVLETSIRPAPAADDAAATTALPPPPGGPASSSSPVDFEDFALTITDRSSADPRAPSDTVEVSLEIEDRYFQARLQSLRQAARNIPRGGGGLLPHKSGAEKRARNLGHQLFEALLTEAGAGYRRRLEAARRQGLGLRLRLRFDAGSPVLAALPWEVLYQGDGEAGVHLGLDAATPIVRSLGERLDDGDVEGPWIFEPPFRLLGLIAQPSDLPELDTVRERRLMETAVRHLTDEGLLELSWVAGGTSEDLAAKLDDGPWHAFHFIGHGGFDEEAYIALAGDDGATRPLTASELGEILAGRPETKLVVLNSCKGARASDDDLYSSFGPALERRGIPAVVAMQAEVSDRAAIHFSATLYEGFAAGLPIDAAVTRARSAIAEDLAPTVEWGTPVLQMGSSDGRLIDLDVTGAIFRRPGRRPGVEPASDPDVEPGGRPPGRLRGNGARRRIESLGRRIGKALERIGPSAASRQRRWTSGRSILRAKVEQFWVKTILEPSADPWAAAGRLLELPGVAAERLAPERSLGGVLGELGSSMLILGPPGSGKTVALFEVARDLLAAADDAERPIPVLFALAEWDDRPGRPLIDWLAARMSLLYGVPSAESRAWLQAGRLALLLDGLDEVAAGDEAAAAIRRRNACVVAINAFAAVTEPAGLVVSCGLKEYLELDERITAAGAVRLETLPRERLLSAVATGGGGRLERLLRRNPALQIQVRSPLWLSFLRQIDPYLPAAGAELLRLDTADEIRHYLLEAYVDSCFRSAPAGGS